MLGESRVIVKERLMGVAEDLMKSSTDSFLGRGADPERVSGLLSGPSLPRPSPVETKRE